MFGTGSRLVLVCNFEGVRDPAGRVSTQKTHIAHQPSLGTRVTRTETNQQGKRVVLVPEIVKIASLAARKANVQSGVDTELFDNGFIMDVLATRKSAKKHV